jgi:hypothetical protein
MSVTDIDGVVSTTKLFVQSPISTLSMSRQCDTLQAAHTLGDIVQVDMTVGIAASPADWYNSVQVS